MPRPVDDRARTVELVERLNEIFQGGGIAAMYERFDELCRPDFAWHPMMAGFGQETYVGRDGFGQYVAEMDATVRDIELTVRDIVAVGDRHVLATARLLMIGRASGAPIETEYALVYRVEGDRLCSGTGYGSHAEAAQAAEAAARA